MLELAYYLMNKYGSRDSLHKPEYLEEFKIDAQEILEFIRRQNENAI